MSAEDSDVARHENGTTDDFGVTRARTRVSRACKRCRSRKDKCDGVQPSCSACLSAGQPCSYEPSTKKRGLPEGYVRGLEKLWAVLIAKVDGLEGAVAHILEENRDNLLQVWNHRQTGEELHTMWKDSRVLQELETFLAAIDITPAHGTKRKRDKDEDDAVLQDGDPDLEEILNPKYEVQMMSIVRGHPLSRPFPAQFTGSSGHLDKLTLPAAASRIIGQYFKFTQCWLPILDRPVVLRRCYEFTKSHTSVDQSNTDLAVLAAALACASQYSGNVNRALDSDLHLDSISLSQLSRKCIPPADGVFELGHVQALLILVLCDIGIGNWEPAWRDVGLAVRALQELLGKSPIPSKNHTATKQACLILETVVALRLGRRPQLCGQDFLANSLITEDGHEEWEPWSAPDSVNFYPSEPAFTISCFNNLTRIFIVLNKFIRSRDVRPGIVSQETLDDTLQALATLEDGYPSPLADSAPRPPHHLWLKASHMLAYAYVVAPESSKTLSALKSLDSVSDIFQTWTNVSSVGLAAMPTVLYGLLHATCELLFSKRSDPAVSLSLSANPFGLGLLADRLNEASASWSEAGHLAKSLREHLGHSVAGALDITQNGSAKRRRGPSYAFESTQTQRAPLNLWPADPFMQTLGSGAQTFNQASDQAAGQPGAPSHPSPQNPSPSQRNVTDALSQGLSGMSRLQKMNLDTTAADNATGSRPYNPSIATSPSFQGDEIDALFREMAQLDTTEWATGRSQGLKDFGFTDDMTFEAFCNDPDRLYSSSAFDNQQMGPIAPVNSFTFDPSLANAAPSSNLNTLDMMDSSWNG